jgi:hypothetical protein
LAFHYHLRSETEVQTTRETEGQPSLLERSRTSAITEVNNPQQILLTNWSLMPSEMISRILENTTLDKRLARNYTVVPSDLRAEVNQSESLSLSTSRSTQIDIQVLQRIRSISVILGQLLGLSKN